MESWTSFLFFSTCFFFTFHISFRLFFFFHALSVSVGSTAVRLHNTKMRSRTFVLSVFWSGYQRHYHHDQLISTVPGPRGVIQDTTLTNICIYGLARFFSFYSASSAAVRFDRNSSFKWAAPPFASDIPTDDHTKTFHILYMCCMAW